MGKPALSSGHKSPTSEWLWIQVYNLSTQTMFKLWSWMYIEQCWWLLWACRLVQVEITTVLNSNLCMFKTIKKCALPRFSPNIWRTKQRQNVHSIRKWHSVHVVFVSTCMAARPTKAWTVSSNVASSASLSSRDTTRPVSFRAASDRRMDSLKSGRCMRLRPIPAHCVPMPVNTQSPVYISEPD